MPKRNRDATEDSVPTVSRGKQESVVDTPAPPLAEGKGESVVQIQFWDALLKDLQASPNGVNFGYVPFFGISSPSAAAVVASSTRDLCPVGIRADSQMSTDAAGAGAEDEELQNFMAKYLT
jgi:glycogen debranching enzyme